MIREGYGNRKVIMKQASKPPPRVHYLNGGEKEIDLVSRDFGEAYDKTFNKVSEIIAKYPPQSKEEDKP